jgi:hypothetical protein
MVNVLESTLASTYGEVIVNYGIGSFTPGFSLDSASALLLPSNIEIFFGETVTNEQSWCYLDSVSNLATARDSI